MLELRIAYHDAVATKMLDLRTAHPFYTWWWCDRGGGTIRSGRSTYTMAPGQWVLLPPNLVRHHRIEPGTVLVSISFEAAWATGTPLLEMQGPLVVNGAGHARLRDAAREVCHAAGAVISKDPPTGIDGVAICRAQGRLSLFTAELLALAAPLGGVLTTPGSGDDRLDRVLREIRLRPWAGPLPWSDWSRRVGLSASQLNRLCRQVHGVSLRRKRDQLLVDELRQRLAMGAGSIKEVAAALGFVDTAHLCRWTRSHTGRSPAELRRDSLA